MLECWWRLTLFCSLEALNKNRKIILISLYYLIWGEAANVRFLPECICYIFHNVSIILFFFPFRYYFIVMHHCWCLYRCKFVWFFFMMFSWNVSPTFSSFAIYGCWYTIWCMPMLDITSFCVYFWICLLRQVVTYMPRYPSKFICNFQLVKLKPLICELLCVCRWQRTWMQSLIHMKLQVALYHTWNKSYAPYIILWKRWVHMEVTLKFKLQCLPCH